MPLIPVENTADPGVTAVDNPGLNIVEPLPQAASASDSIYTSDSGRAGKQARLRELAEDDKVSAADRGWIQQEINAIEAGNRNNIRVPPGKVLAHRRGYEARKGYGYEHSDLQDTELHKLQHRHEGYR